jgi:hypothetical protein
MKPSLLALAGPALLATLLGACASMPAASPVPEALKPAANESLFKVLFARGVQIYECRVTATGTEWAFIAPEAELLEGGQVVGKHYAGPHWESNDGSKVKGTVKARADAPRPGAIVWLLLTTQSVGPAGAYAQVSSIQRVNTVGGIAPTQACTATQAGQQVRVPYTADYRLFVAG